VQGQNSAEGNLVKILKRNSAVRTVN